MKDQPDLWGNEQPVFQSAKERYGVWPTTVWDVDYSDAGTKELVRQIGDLRYESEASEAGADQTRAGSFSGTGGYGISASVFSPAVAQWILNCFAPEPPANVFDPFGGGGTRAIMSAHSGYNYIGIEIRPEEVEAVARRIKAAGVADRAEVRLGNSQVLQEYQMPDEWADFLMTCPPYFNLEMYNGPAGDLSMMRSYDLFVHGIRQVVRTTARILKPGALSVWVTGMHRHPNGDLIPIHHDIASMHHGAGFKMNEEVVLNLKNTGAIQRVGNFDRGSHRLIRTHEYLQVFQKD